MNNAHVIRAIFSRCHLTCIFHQLRYATLVISVTGAPEDSLARIFPHQAQPPTVRGPGSVDFTADEYTRSS